ncbi:Uncharacterized protein MLTONO_6423 [Mesorhizobium loti]|nr:Uncharacterized protein MLTONO_6423 [Mesorhizobium loti]
MPGRAIGNERVPSLRAPALGNPAALEDKMRHAAFAQMLRHSHSRLATADDKRVYFFHWHFCVLSPQEFPRMRGAQFVGLLEGLISENYDFAWQWLACP